MPDAVVVSDKSESLPVLDGEKTAALLLMLFGEDEAAMILSRLEPLEIEKLGESMFAIADVSEQEVNLVLDQFVKMASGRNTIGYRADQQIQNMMHKALGDDRAENIMQRITPVKDVQHLPQLKWMKPDDIFEMLKEQHPQVIALMLSQMESDQAGTVLQMLPQEIQGDVIYRVSTLDTVRIDAIVKLEELLVHHLQTVASEKTIECNGIDGAAAIVANVSKDDAKRILKSLNKKDKKIGVQIEEQMFVFDDLFELDQKSLGALLRVVDTDLLVPAIKGCDPKLAAKIYGCMSLRAAQTIQDEIEELGPVAMSDVVTAQKSIVGAARKLADEGTIVLGDDGGDYV